MSEPQMTRSDMAQYVLRRISDVDLRGQPKENAWVDIMAAHDKVVAALTEQRDRLVSERDQGYDGWRACRAAKGSVECELAAATERAETAERIAATEKADYVTCEAELMQSERERDEARSEAKIAQAFHAELAAELDLAVYKRRQAEAGRDEANDRYEAAKQRWLGILNEVQADALMLRPRAEQAERERDEWRARVQGSANQVAREHRDRIAAERERDVVTLERAAATERAEAAEAEAARLRGIEAAAREHAELSSVHSAFRLQECFPDLARKSVSDETVEGFRQADRDRAAGREPAWKRAALDAHGGEAGQ